MVYEAESARLYLQRLSVDEHLDDFFELWNNPAALIWLPHKPKTTLEETRPFMLENLPERNPDTDKFAVLLKPIEGNPQPWVNKKGSAKMIGMVGTNRWSAHGMEAGYCFNYNYWGKGYASEAFRLFLSLYWKLPERGDIKYLVAKIDVANTASQRVAQRVGARKGELLEERFKLASDDEDAKKRDADCWYLDRPGCEASNLREWEGRDVKDIKRRDREAAEAWEKKEMEKKDKEMAKVV